MLERCATLTAFVYLLKHPGLSNISVKDVGDGTHLLFLLHPNIKRSKKQMDVAFIELYKKY